jgi:hypothetical protein
MRQGYHSFSCRLLSGNLPTAWSSLEAVQISHSLVPLRSRYRGGRLAIVMLDFEVALPDRERQGLGSCPSSFAREPPAPACPSTQPVPAAKPSRHIGACKAETRCRTSERETLGMRSTAIRCPSWLRRCACARASASSRQPERHSWLYIEACRAMSVPHHSSALVVPFLSAHVDGCAACGHSCSLPPACRLRGEATESKPIL